MTTATRCFRHQDYTVAWICALPLEMAAAAAMLDERHHDLPTKPHDANTYILGRIFSHNVAIACLPSGVYGTTSATSVATQMQSTFESIRFYLMVGIGGGVPSENVDIRLGDVVVSKPTRDSGGVIQYDYGKTVAGGRFERAGVLNKPPQLLLTAVSKLQAEHRLAPSKIPALLSEAVARNPLTTEKFAYRGEDQDLLFDYEYDHHDSGNTFNNCDTTRVVPRAARASHDSVIHYGLIASGNQVIKHGRTRDKLARDLDIFCFEMEAAGLMDNFPCLVIRGICDYSDSHKNKQWQDYAAATAAAYSKELLSVVHASHVMNTPTARSINNVSHYRGRPPSEMKFANSEIIQHDDQEVEGLLERISSYDHERIHHRLSRKRLTGTTHWFLDHPDFEAWFTRKEISSLWCSGKIGSGKTMIATAAIDAAKDRLGAPTVFFYCENEHHTVIDASSILSSFIKQLCEFIHRTSRIYPEDVAREIRKFFGHKRVKPDIDDLNDIFCRLFPHVSDTIYVVDGIDVLHREHAISILEVFRSLLRSYRPQRGSRVLLLSRDQVQGYININTSIPGIRQISTSANVMQDIQTYIKASITDKTMYRILTHDPLLIEEIPRRLLEESSGMFLWVYLQLEILWDTCHTDAEIRSALTALPKGLEETYGRCVERINRKDTRVLKVLKWVSFATSPLHIEELREAVAFAPEDTAWNSEKIPGKEFVIGCCANLLVLDSTDDHVRFAHSSVQQYLEKGRERNTIQGYPNTAQGILECGEFCIAYLSFSDFSLQLSTRRYENAAVAFPTPISLAKQTLPGFVTGRFIQKLRGRRHFVSVPFREIRTASTPDRTQYKFLDYAVTNWALQTKQIPRTSPIWEKFERLAMCFNQTWNIHPWVPGGHSKISHFHGLFGWAVMEQHEPLLSIAQATESDFRLVCNLPLIGEGLLALHVAAKLGHTSIVKILLDFCNPNARDLEGYIALHHAASRGHVEICQLLGSAGVDALSKSRCTPLWLAASNGHNEVASFLIQNKADIEAKDAPLQQTPLSRAAQNGHDAIVNLLLRQGAKFELQDSDGRTPLSRAAQNGHDAVVKLLLREGAEVGLKDADNETPLSWALEGWHENKMKLLLEGGAQGDIECNRRLLPWAAKNGYKIVFNLFSADAAGTDPKEDPNRALLLWATEEGYEAVVKMLLEDHADVEATGWGWGQTLLSRAAENGRVTVVQLLLEKGADIEAKDNKWGQTPFLWAAENGHHTVVKVLLDHGADINAKDMRRDQTSLSRAAENGFPIVVKLLLERGVDIDARVTKQGQTSLSRAAGNGCEIAVQVLLENGADIEAKDTDRGQTPLSWAAANGHGAVVTILLEKGADIEAKDTNMGQTPLSWAAANCHGAVVTILLEKGADLEAKDTNKSGMTPLLYAASKGNGVAVKILLEKGADIEARDECGLTPLIWAIWNCHEAVVRVLLEKGADVEAKDTQELGLTPLLYAASKGNGVAVKILLEKGADIEARDECGLTPLTWAMWNKDEAVARMLLEKGADIEARDECGRSPLTWATLNNDEAVARMLLEKVAVLDGDG